MTNTGEDKCREALHTRLPWGMEITSNDIWIGPMRRDGFKVDDVAIRLDYDSNYTDEARARIMANAHLIVDSVNHRAPASESLVEKLEALMKDQKDAFSEAASYRFDGYNDAVEDAIAIVRAHQPAQPPEDFREVEPWASILWRAEKILRDGNMQEESIHITAQKLRADLDFHFPPAQAVSLERCVKPAYKAWLNDSGDFVAIAKAVLDAAGVKYGE